MQHCFTSSPPSLPQETDIRKLQPLLDSETFRITGTDHSPDNSAHDCVSEEALAQLAAYKYSSVDNSFLTHYVLRHYVRANKAPKSFAVG